jgi:hypothetical protein
MSIRPVVHAVRCTYPQCQATNGCIGVCSKTAPVAKTTTTQWVGLTDEERKLIIHEWRHQEGKAAQLCQAIEAKLKEKNT